MHVHKYHSQQMRVHKYHRQLANKYVYINITDNEYIKHFFISSLHTFYLSYLFIYLFIHYLFIYLSIHFLFIYLFCGGGGGGHVILYFLQILEFIALILMWINFNPSMDK